MARELLASEICQCFDIPQVRYHPYVFEGQVVTESRIVTSKRYSVVSKMAFDIYACNHDLDTLEFCRDLDPVRFGERKQEAEMFQVRLDILKKV